MIAFQTPGGIDMPSRIPALVILPLALGACGNGNEQETQPLELGGSWRTTIWFQSETCGLPEGYLADIVILELTQAGTDVTVVDPDGDILAGEASAGAVSFNGTKLDTDDDTGCETTRTLSAGCTGCESSLEGDLSDAWSFDEATCGSTPDCRINSSLWMTKLFDPDRVPAPPPADQVCPGTVSCIGRDTFEVPAESDYILPFPAGESYRLTQSYCFPHSSHKQQLAYDFEMPLGSEITAARGGVVREIKQDSPDEGDYPLNHVLIQHDDGTVAFYAHLTENGVLVAVDDTVEAGQLIAYSGSSGNTEPHLHFGVYANYPPQEGDDRAVNFRNNSGQHDFRGGLVMGETYTAE
jgi:hypothetical protein